MRYLASSKFLWSLDYKKYFGLILAVALKLEYLFWQGKEDTSFEFE